MIIPPLPEFAQQVTNEVEAINWLSDNGIIKPLCDEICHEIDCGGRMSVKDKTKSWRQLKCNRCRTAQSRFAHYFFDDAKMDIHTILYLGIMWLAKSSVQTAISFSKLAKETVTNYYGHFRQLVPNMIDETNLKIRGPGIEVKIDESKFTKRKYNRGHCVGNNPGSSGGLRSYCTMGS